MEDIYQIMDEKKSGSYTPTESFDKQAWGEKKQEERAHVFELIDKASLEVNQDTATLGRYLDVMAALPSHSVSNTLLVYEQKPDATRIGDSDYWSKQSASIKRGEHGISILEPGKEYTRDDGSIGVFYNVKKVFDVTQTTARTRLPRRNSLHDVLVALVGNSPVPIRPTDDLSGELAAYDHEAKSISVQKGLSEPQLFWALAMELAHASMAEGQETYDRASSEGKAELATSVVARRFGIPAFFDTLPAPAAPDADAAQVRTSLTEVRQAAKDISDCARSVLDRPRQQEQTMQR